MRAFGLCALLFASPALAQTASPVPTSMPEDGSPPLPPSTTTKPGDDTFDAAAAKKALGAVDYKDCGKGGPGKILVTFTNDGSVERVVLAEGSWQPEVAICVTRRFADAKVPAFIGATHTVKYAVQLEGGPPAPAATYAAPPPGGAPTYNPYMVPRSDVIEGTDGPPPPGYHVEERRRSGALISGSIITGMGLVFTALAFDDGSRSSKETMQIAAIVHFAVGVPLFCVGLGTRRVFVADRISLVPTIHRSGGGASLAITF
jgi:hypothetical protein